jgi:nucleoside 2-deoxyribosyltransferase
MVVFVAAPFTNKIRDGRIDPLFREELELLIGMIKRLGFDVLNSHIREEWGDATPSPHELVVEDYHGLLSSDVVVVYVDETPSFGTHVELGWASALGKSTIVATKNGVETTPLVDGLGDGFPVYRIIFENKEDILVKLENQLLKIREGLK